MTDWIEQYQQFHRAAPAEEPDREWEERAFWPAFSPGAVQRDMEELKGRLAQLANRIQALERR